MQTSDKGLLTLFCLRAAAAAAAAARPAKTAKGNEIDGLISSAYWSCQFQVSSLANR